MDRDLFHYAIFPPYVSLYCSRNKIKIKIKSKKIDKIKIELKCKGLSIL